MLSTLRARIAVGYREQGSSMIELLVGMLAGIVVIAAVVGLLTASEHESTRTFSKVDATQRGRVEIEAIESELHSACVGDGAAPIQVGSTGTSLSFVSYYGDQASPIPVWHNIAYSGGTLTDYSYAVGGSAPSWTQGSLTGTKTLLTNVSQNGSEPVFQYFAYQEAPNGSGGYYTDGDGNPYMLVLDGTSSVPGTSPAVYPTPSPLAVPLSANDAQNAVEVLINLVVGPSGGTFENTNLADAAVPVTDSVVLRMTPPNDHAGAGATFGPCQ